MGLDTTAARSEADIDPDSGMLTEEARLVLTEMFGEYPEFRGKLWSDAVQRLTGESLYQEWIPPSVVKRMLRSLERAVGYNPVTYDGKQDKAAAEDLIPFFRVCAANDLGITGSW